MKPCKHCGQGFERRGGWRIDACPSCQSGVQRVAALARQGRPHLLELNRDARSFMLAFETARLAFTRALRPFGIRVVWRGFEPRVSVVPRPGIESPPGDC